MTIDANNTDPQFAESVYNIDPSLVLNGLDVAPNDVLIGGPESCFTVTGLKVESTRDALIVFEACRQGVLPRIKRRLNDAEKQLIGDGTVIVFDEREAGMKRWTDGKLWTPSRILGNFLTYRELDKKLPPNQQGMAEVARWTTASATVDASGECGLNFATARSDGMPESACVTNKGVLFTKANGLIKRTISLTVPDNEPEFLSRNEWRPLKVHHQHLVVYFRAETAALLPRPEDMEELEALRLPLRILQIQKFRRPVRVEMFEDGSYEFHDSVDAEGGDEDALPQPPMPRVAAEGINPQTLGGPDVARSSSAVGSSQNHHSISAVYPLPPPPPPQMSLAMPFQLAALVASGARGEGGYRQLSPPTPLVLQPPASTSSSIAAPPQEQSAISAGAMDSSISSVTSVSRGSDYGNCSNTSIA
ncbi:Global transcription regulator sge1, partial [Coemansia erecta]